MSYSIVPASHKRSADPPVVLLSDSYIQEAISRIQSPRRSPRSMSTPQRAPRVTSTLFQGPSAEHVPQTPSNPLYPSLPSGSPMGGLNASNRTVATLSATDTAVARTPTLRSRYAILTSQTPQRRLQLQVQLRQKSQNQFLLAQGAQAISNHHSQRCRTIWSHKLLLLRVPGRQVETERPQLATEVQFATKRSGRIRCLFPIARSNRRQFPGHPEASLYSEKRRRFCSI